MSVRALYAFYCICLLLGPTINPKAIMSQNRMHNECVILLHGLTRSARSMGKIEQRLSAEGFRVRNVDYPSRKMEIEQLATTVIPREVEACRQMGAERIHFVTHSMGGILVRAYLRQQMLEELGRVVMLSPPNQGSEVVDKIGWLPGFQLWNGPAGLQLGTDARSVPMELGPVDYPVGVITGNRSINWILSLLIPGPDDGKVSVERAKVEGMADFLIVPHTHPLIMYSPRVIEEVNHFLQVGQFRAR